MTAIHIEDEVVIRTGIATLQQIVHKTAVEHGWWEDEDAGGERNMGEMIALMHSELSEALESVRSNEPDLWFRPSSTDPVPTSTGPLDHEGNPMKPEGVASEFADTIIRIMDTCQRRGIPLTEAIIRKAEYNDSRPYKHGGRAF